MSDKETDKKSQRETDKEIDRLGRPKEQDPNLSFSSDSRWEYTSTVGFMAVVLGVYGVWGYLVVSEKAVPEMLNWAIIFGTALALVYGFGPKTLRAYQEFRQGGD